MMNLLSKRIYILVMCIFIIASVFTIISVDADSSINGINGLGWSNSNGKGTWESNDEYQLTGKVAGNVFLGFIPRSETTKCHLTNNSGCEALLSFKYTYNTEPASDIVFTIDGVDAKNETSYKKILSAGDSVEIVLSSPEGSGTLSTVRLTTISLTPYTESSFSIYKPDNNNIISINGNEIDVEAYLQAEDDNIYKYTEEKVNSIEGITVSTTTVSGMEFVGWIDDEDIIHSRELTDIILPKKDLSLVAKFIDPQKECYFAIDDKAYQSLGEAIKEAKSGDTIYPLSNGTIVKPTETDTYSIPSGVTLLIPFDDLNTCYRKQPAYSTSVAGKCFRKIVLGNDVIINVKNGGEISVSAKHRPDGRYIGSLSGDYGCIEMKEGSSINLADGSSLYCWGFIVGKGQVIANGGSTVHEYMQLADWRGGTISKAMLNNEYDVLPFSQYYFQNIEVPLKICAGASEKAYVSITAGGYTAGSEINFIGANSLFSMSDGAITKDYDEENDRLNFILDGSAEMKSLSVAISMFLFSAEINTADYTFPLNGNITLTIKEGSDLKINFNTSLLPGAEINIDEAATVTVGENATIFAYNASNWGDYVYSGTNKEFAIPAFYPSSIENRLKQYNNDPTSVIKDVSIDNNGTINVLGGLYTTSEGGNIHSSEGTGRINYSEKSNSATVSLYQAKSVSEKPEYHAIDSIVKATLRNGTALTDNPYVSTGELEKPNTIWWVGNDDIGGWAKKPTIPQTVSYKEGIPQSFVVELPKVNSDDDPINVLYSIDNEIWFDSVINAGKYNVRFANGNWKSDLISTSAAFIIEKINQDSFSILSEDVVKYGEHLELSASGGSGNGEVTYFVEAGTGKAEVASQGGIYELIPKQAGTVTITAIKAESVNYYSTSASKVVTIEKAEQSDFTITSASIITYGNNLVLGTSGGSGTGAVSYEVENGTGEASITSEGGIFKLIPEKAGYVTVTAIKAADNNYNQTSDEMVITINKANQSALNITSAATMKYGEELMLETEGGSGDGEVSYTVVAGSDHATITSEAGIYKLVPVKAGTVTVQATKASDDNYHEVVTEKVITIEKAAQKPLVIKNDLSVDFDETLEINVDGGDGEGAFSYSVADNTLGKARIENGVLIPEQAGEVSLTVTKAADDNYEAVSVTETIKINMVDQEPLVIGASGTTFGTNVALNVTGGSGTGELSYSVTNVSGKARIENGQLVPEQAGEVTVTVTKAANVNYNQATATKNIIISKANQSIVSVKSDDTVKFGQTLTLDISGGNGEGTVSYTIVTGGTGEATISGNELTSDKAGTVKVVATKAEDNNYNEAVSAEKVITIEKADQNAPSLTVSQPAVIGGKGLVIDLNTAMEWSTSTSESAEWKRVTDTEATSGMGIEVEDGDTVTRYFRYAQTDNYNAGAVTTVAITAFVPSKENTPNATVDYVDEKLVGLIDGAKYKISGTAISASSTGGISIDAAWFGQSVDIVKAGNGTTTIDSEVQSIDIPARPTAPTLEIVKTTGDADGKIIGLDSDITYEYRASGADTWVEVSGNNEISGLDVGTYEVRVKASQSNFSGNVTTVEVNRRQLTGISVTTKPTKVTYVEGDTFSTEGMVVTATYDNDTSKDVTGYTVTPSGILTSDVDFVTVSYTEADVEKTATVDITVLKKIGNVTVADASYEYDKVAHAFDVPESLTTLGGIKVEYRLHSEPDTNEWSDSDPVTVGEYDVRISRNADGEYTSYEQIIEKAVVITARPVVIKWTGNEFTYDNETKSVTAEISNLCTGDAIALSVDGDSAVNAGDYTAKVTALSGDDSANYTLTGGQNVEHNWMINNADMYDVTAPAITIYTNGQAYDLVASAKTFGDNVVAYEYSIVSEGDYDYVDLDSSAKTVTAPENGTQAAIQVKVVMTAANHNTVEKTFTVNVVEKAISSVELISSPSKLTGYVEGQKINLDGMKIKVDYNDGSSEDVDANANASKFSTDILVTGQTAVDVMYLGNKVTVNLTEAVAKKAITSISITSSIQKTEYIIGDVLDLTGLEVTAQYNDGTSAVLDSADYTVDGFDSSSATDGQKITITAEGKSAQFSVDINKKTLTAGDFDISIADGLVYDGNEKSVTITTKDGIEAGEITVLYNGSMNKPKDAGSYAVTFDVAESDTYYVATGLQAGTLNIGKANLTINAPESINTVLFASPVAINTTVGGVISDEDGVVLSYSSSDASAVTVDNNGVVTANKYAEGVNITVSFAGNDNYNSASAEVLVNVTKAEQAALNIVQSEMTYGNTLALSVTGGSIDSAVCYSVENGTGQATISGNELTPVKAGTVTVTAIKAGDNDYNEVRVSKTITINKANQSALNITSAAIMKYGEELVLETEGGSGDGEVSYTIVAGSDHATITSEGGIYKLIPVKAGTVTVQATKASDDNYHEVVTEKVITIEKAAQKPLAIKNDLSVDFDQTLVIKVDGGDGEGAVSYSVADNTSGKARIENGILIPEQAGEVSLTVTKATDDNYEAVSVTETIKINMVDQEPLVIGASGTTFGTNVALNVTGGSGTGELSYSITNGSGKARIENGQLVPEQAGEVTVTVTKAANVNYNQATATKNIIISKANQSIVSVKSDDTVKFGQTLILDISGGDGDGAVSYAIVTGGTGEATISSNVLTPDKAGIVKVVVTKSEDKNYNEAVSAEKVITVEKADAPASIQDVTASYKYIATGERNVSISGVPINAGEVACSVGSVTDAKGVLDGTPTVSADGKVTFSLKGLGSYEDGISAVIPVMVTMTNYQSKTVNVVISITNRLDPTLTLDDIIVDYTGIALGNDAIEGSAQYDGESVRGTLAWAEDMTGRVNAGTYNAVSVKFTPEDIDTYNPVVSTLKLTVNKIDPTGTPEYTTITSAGKTLADADLKVGTITPSAGAIVWDDGDTTVVESGKAYNWTFTPEDSVNYNVLTGSITPYTATQSGGLGGGGGAAGGGGGGGMMPPEEKPEEGVQTEIKENGDKVTVETKEDGSKVETVESENGSTSTTTVNVDGSKETVVDLSQEAVTEAVENGAPVVLPMVDVDGNTSTSITVNTGNGGSVSVAVPVKDIDYGIVAIEIQDGSEEIIIHSIPTEDGLVVNVPDGANIKIVDNGHSFIDVDESDWFHDAVDFNFARGVINGVTEDLYAPEQGTTRAMVWTILARISGVDTSGGENWYDVGREWAMENGISDGTFHDQEITREQLVTMLWRYIGEPDTEHSIGGYTDHHETSDWAVDAFNWAVDQGVISGMGDNTLNPGGNATRAQVAQMKMNFIINLLGA